jgi:hypothetical protein
VFLLTGIPWLVFAWIVLSFNSSTVWAVVVLAAIIGWFVLFAGIVEILIGFCAVGCSGRSIALLVVWVGAVALASGISNLFVAFGLHRIGKQLRQRIVPAGWEPTVAGRRTRRCEHERRSPPLVQGRDLVPGSSRPRLPGALRTPARQGHARTIARSLSAASPTHRPCSIRWR